MLATPKIQNSPENDLSNVVGVKKMFATPKIQNAPKNDLSNVPSVKGIFKTPRVKRTPKPDYTNISGIEELFTDSDVPEPCGSSSDNLQSETQKQEMLTLTQIPEIHGVKDVYRFLESSPLNYDELKEIMYSKKLSGKENSDLLNDKDPKLKTESNSIPGTPTRKSARTKRKKNFEILDEIAIPIKSHRTTRRNKPDIEINESHLNKANDLKILKETTDASNAEVENEGPRTRRRNAKILTTPKTVTKEEKIIADINEKQDYDIKEEDFLSKKENNAPRRPKRGGGKKKEQPSSETLGEMSVPDTNAVEVYQNKKTSSKPSTRRAAKKNLLDENESSAAEVKADDTHVTSIAKNKPSRRRAAKKALLNANESNSSEVTVDDIDVIPILKSRRAGGRPNMAQKAESTEHNMHDVVVDIKRSNIVEKQIKANKHIQKELVDAPRTRSRGNKVQPLSTENLPEAKTDTLKSKGKVKPIENEPPIRQSKRIKNKQKI